MQVSESELKQFILDSGLVARTEVEAAEEEGKKRSQSAGDILVSQGFLSSDALRRVKSYVLGIPFVNLKGQRIALEVLSIIPEPIARAHSIVVFKRNDDGLEVAMLDTEDFASIDSIRENTGLKILPRLTDEGSLTHALMQYQKLLKEEFGDLIALEAGKVSVVKETPAGETSAEHLKKIAEDLPIVRIVDTLLKHAIIQSASDIHIEPMEAEVLVRYRIDGALYDAMTLPKSAALGITARIKVLANLKLDEQRLPQDGRFKMETETDKVSFRVSLMPTYFGEKVVMRLLHETGEGFTLDVLGLHGDGLERIHKATRQRGGLILITGPSGAGKTTTLYTILDILNTPSTSLASIEDPIEYQMKRVNQTQVNPALGFTFADGLRALVRQDPDVIMVGEIRDKETAMLAVHAALTGHLVLSTIDTRSAAAAIPHLLALGVESHMLASALRVVVGQRLVRKLCDGKIQYALDARERATIAKEENFTAALHALVEEKLVTAKTEINSVPFYLPKASPKCEDGYSGRIGIHEVLSNSSTLRELIQQGASASDVETQARKEGMLTILEDGIYKAARGITSLEEVLGVVGS